MPQGKIKKLTEKGFGFIETDHGDLFFHMSALRDASFEQLYEGQAVEFESGQGPKGPRAEWVKALD
ncbi:MAG: cold-shock protein [Planctomycetaceae bacterium]